MWTLRWNFGEFSLAENKQKQVVAEIMSSPAKVCSKSKHNKPKTLANEKAIKTAIESVTIRVPYKNLFSKRR